MIITQMRTLLRRPRTHNHFSYDNANFSIIVNVLYLGEQEYLVCNNLYNSLIVIITQIRTLSG